MLLEIVNTVNSYLSDYILVFLLIGVGLWYTIRTRFVQIATSGRACAACSATCPSGADGRSGA